MCLNVKDYFFKKEIYLQANIHNPHCHHKSKTYHRYTGAKEKGTHAYHQRKSSNDKGRNYKKKKNREGQQNQRENM